MLFSLPIRTRSGFSLISCSQFSYICGRTPNSMHFFRFFPAVKGASSILFLPNAVSTPPIHKKRSFFLKKYFTCSTICMCSKPAIPILYCLFIHMFLSYPLIPLAAIPSVKNFCNAANITKTGINETMEAAMIRLYSDEYCEINILSPSCSVFFSKLLK